MIRWSKDVVEAAQAIDRVVMECHEPPRSLIDDFVACLVLQVLEDSEGRVAAEALAKRLLRGPESK